MASGATRVLFDTNVVAFWLRETPGFKLPIKKVLGDLRRKKAQKFISVVTVQELEVWARHGQGEYLDKLRTFLGAHFGPPLIFDHAMAKMAAQLAAVTPRKEGATGSERKDITNAWHRDASIAAAAQQHGMSAVITANAKDFVAFKEHVDWELVDVRPV